ncbi:MAG: hypothetical protein H0X42_12425, partial [Solirubrobacterales bacterium]|nr:hypothetical protein [Solirubrobacterales bacterium]
MKRFIPLLASLVLLTCCAGSAQAAFGLSEFSVAFRNADGTQATQAGSHPYAMTTVFRLNSHTVSGESGSGVFPDQELRTLSLSLPVGFVGNVVSLPRCSFVDFKTVDEEPGHDAPTSCPDSAAVGAVGAYLLGGTSQTAQAAVYNLEPPPGDVAALGFRVATVPVIVELRINPIAPNNVVAIVPNLTQAALTGSFLELWGNPSDPSHDPYRGSCLDPAAGPPELGEFVSRGDCPVSQTGPFLTLPRACQAPGLVTYSALSWQGSTDVGSTTTQATNGCNRLGFAPTISARPTSQSGGSAAGLDFSVNVEDSGLTSSAALAASDIKHTVVTLPPGFVTNPSLAEGLQACSEEALARETPSSPPGAGCPEAAKIGSLEVETPLLQKTLAGSLYTATPYHNLAGDSLLGVYLVIKDPELGVLIEQPLKVTPDPVTGRLAASAESIPQLPFSHFRLYFRSGERAPLTTPSTCGSYQASAVLTPWSGGPPVPSTSTFEITTGPAGGACQAAAPPFAPAFEAGTVSPLAGARTPFVLKLSRAAGSPQLRSIETTLPQGLLGKLAGVSECSDAAIAAAQGREAPNLGALELAAPSCPPASEVGTVTVGAGSGAPTYVRGRAYLAGPYKGAPLSLEIITPAVAGPFDLGTVAVRTALYVDPITAQIHAVSDPIPSILAGIPLDIRSIAIDLSRPKFTLNPTSCDPMVVLGATTSTLNQTTALSSRFQVGGCNGLAFKPKLALRLSGSTQRGKNPALRAVLTQAKGQANIAKVSVVLPKSEFIDNRHINNPCTRVQFNAGAGNGAQCPAKSILGHATAYTPLLEKPLKGPVYFRSNGGERQLPDLVASLGGQVHLNVVGFIDSVHKKG